MYKNSQIMSSPLPIPHCLVAATTIWKDLRACSALTILDVVGRDDKYLKEGLGDLETAFKSVQYLNSNLNSVHNRLFVAKPINGQLWLQLGYNQFYKTYFMSLASVAELKLCFERPFHFSISSYEVCTHIPGSQNHLVVSI